MSGCPRLGWDFSAPRYFPSLVDLNVAFWAHLGEFPSTWVVFKEEIWEAVKHGSKKGHHFVLALCSGQGLASWF